MINGFNLPEVGTVPAPQPKDMQRRWSDGIPGVVTPSQAAGPWSLAQQWPTLVATLSEQGMESSKLVLKALDYLIDAGRLRPNEAKSLQEALQRMRDTSGRAQQIMRLASGRIRQAKDRVDLALVIRSMLEERRRELEGKSVKVHTELSSVDVWLDPTVAVGVLGTLIDWALTFSKGVALTLEAPLWPQPARLLVRVANPPRPADGAVGASPTGQGSKERRRRLNDGLYWMLLRQTAASANLSVTRSSVEGAALLTVEFPKTFMNAGGVSSVELFDEDPATSHSLADVWVLVITDDPPLRAAALETLRYAGLSVKGVGTVAEARSVMAEARPNLLVVGPDAKSSEFETLRSDALGRDAPCPVVEISPEAPSFHRSGFEGVEVVKVKRDDVRRELAPTVLFELAKFA